MVADALRGQGSRRVLGHQGIADMKPKYSVPGAPVQERLSGHVLRTLLDTEHCGATGDLVIGEVERRVFAGLGGFVGSPIELIVVPLVGPSSARLPADVNGGEGDVTDDDAAAVGEMMADKALQERDFCGEIELVEDVCGDDSVERAPDLGGPLSEQVGLDEGGLREFFARLGKHLRGEVDSPEMTAEGVQSCGEVCGADPEVEHGHSGLRIGHAHDGVEDAIVSVKGEVALGCAVGVVTSGPVVEELETVASSHRWRLFSC